MRRCSSYLFAILAFACGDDGPGADAALGGPDAGGACPTLGAISVDGDAVPGRQVALGLVGTAAAAEWTVTAGALSAATGATVTWTPPVDAAVHVPEPATITATARAAGCADVSASAEVVIDWPPGLRTVVLYDPAVTGSQDVAAYYAELRAIPAEHLCAVSASDPTVLPGGAYEAFLATVMDCVDAVGPHVHYLVPVWGVPYKVEGRIDDLAGTGAKATVSLDALLAYGRGSAALGAPASNPIYQYGASLSATYQPYVPFGQLRPSLAGDYFLVARIDGADAAAAMALVDRTAEAEARVAAGTLTGTVYVDGNRGLPHPASDAFGSYEGGEWNIIGVENVMTAFGRHPVVADYDGAEFGTDPAPLTCPDALYYAGWYSFGNYNDVFTWVPGAIGGHLDSCSACDLRGDRDWSARALRRGITATFGAVNEPYVAGMPEYDQFFLYLTQGASYGEAAYESTVFGAWMVVWAGDPLYRPYPSP